MSDVVSKLFRKSGLLAVGITLFISALTAGVMLVAQPGPAAAAPSCPSQIGSDQDTDIIYGGLSGGSDVNAIKNSLQQHFTSGNGGNGCTDVNAIYTKLGLTNSMFNSGETWILGKSMRDGTIVDNNGKVLATDVSIASRCWNNRANCQDSSNYKYTQLEGNIYMHPTKWFTNGINQNNIPTLIHINKTTGAMDFAAMVDCGNAAQFIAIVPQNIYCKKLDAKFDTTDDSLNYTFTVTANVQNYTEATYYINYGDNTPTVVVTDKVNEGDNTHSFTHPYQRLDTDTTYTVWARINNLQDVQGLCKKQLIIPAKSKKLVFACQALTALQVSSGTGTVTYRYTASVSGTDTPKNYTFNFSDQAPVTTTDNTITRTYNYDVANPQSYNVSFFATSNTGLQTDQNDKDCQFSFKPTSVRTGPAGTMGLIAATSFGGVALHQFLIRRKLTA